MYCVCLMHDASDMFGIRLTYPQGGEMCSVLKGPTFSSFFASLSVRVVRIVFGKRKEDENVGHDF